jgi:hypothetical protein
MITIYYKDESSEEIDDEVSLSHTGNFLVLDYNKLNVDTNIDEIWKKRYISLDSIVEIIDKT